MKWSEIKVAGEWSKIAIGTLIRSKLSKELAQRYLFNELSLQQGIPAKALQLMGLLSVESVMELPKEEPLDSSFIRVLIEEYSPSLSNEIIEFSSQGQIASIGQVHWARLKSGEEVAIKVLLPGVKEEIQNQISSAIKLARMYPKAQSFGLEFGNYEKFLSSLASEETDYSVEMTNQEKFVRAWQGCPDIVIPRVYSKWSNSNILVQTYEKSVGVKEIVQMPREFQKKCARLLSSFVLESVRKHALVHGDLHFSNWGYSVEKAALVVYDFGAILNLNESIRSAIDEMLKVEQPTDLQANLFFEKMNFDMEKLAPISDKLRPLLCLLLEPFRAKGEFFFNNWKLHERVDSLLGEQKWLFRTAGPPWFMIMMRTFLGWGAAMERLGESMPSLVNLSRFLKVRVTEGGVERVMLTMPSGAVERIEFLIPDEVLDSIKAHGIDIEKVKELAIKSRLAPQELFNWLEESKGYRVWLE